jgi:hypothetical protein
MSDLVPGADYLLGQSLHVVGVGFFKVIDGTGYTITNVDRDLGAGLVAQQRTDQTNAKGRDSFPDSTTPLGVLTDGEQITFRRYTGDAAGINPGLRVQGSNVQIFNNEFNADDENIQQVVLLEDGADQPIISRNLFKGTGYQIIQQSGEQTRGIRAVENTAINCINDFLLQNNDSQNGITHSWLVSFNYVDATDSTVSYGATESRGVSFTSCYGGINIANAMVGVKGDSATHLENIQETVHGFNYYRDCFKDILFSGTGRRLISLASLSGADTIAPGDELVGSTSGATVDVLFYFANYETIQDNNRVGSFQIGESFTVTGKDVAGTILYIDPVQVHANVIGNVFHKTSDLTTKSVNLGINNYHLRSHFIGNTYNNQVVKGNNSIAVACAFAFDSDHSEATYRGWDTAFKGGTSAGPINIRNSYFWNNTYNIDGAVWKDSVTEGNKFFDGITKITDLEDSRFEDNVFESGEIDIVSGGGSNSWINNFVSSDVTITNLDPQDFSTWESETYSRKGSFHEIRSRSTIFNGSTLKQLVATLEGGPSRMATIKWELASRDVTAAPTNYAQMGRAIIDWDSSGNPSITLDPNNFESGNKKCGFSIDVSGVEVELNYDYVSDNNKTYNTLKIEITGEAVNVSPVDFIDLI